MRGETELNTTRTGGVHLWPGEFNDYEIEVFPEEGAPYTRTVNSTSYAHARRVVLSEVGPRDRVPNREFRS